MNREYAKQEIRRRWREIMPGITDQAPGKMNGEKSWVCPLCGSGSGPRGTGITRNPKSRDGNSLHCFGCDYSGDIIDLYQKVKNCTYQEAFSLLADSLGIIVEDAAPYQNARSKPQEAQEAPSARLGGKNTADTINGQKSGTEAKIDYTDYYRQCRARINDPAAVAYLQSRGISVETAAAYWLGYDPEWRSPTAVRAGKHPPASPRIIIPESASSYTARDARKTLGEQEERYAKLREGDAAFFNGAALYAQDVQELFITEGAFDALAIMEAGRPVAMSLQSAANAQLLVKEIEARKPAATLILALDNDEKGRKTTEYLAGEFKKLGVDYIVADVCGGCKDPAEALQDHRIDFFKALGHTLLEVAPKPDNTFFYIDHFMDEDIERFKTDLKTGYPLLDKQAGGLYSGLYVIAAISSLGKTTFAAQMADQIAAAGTDVLYFSLEQSRLEVVSKSLARITAQNDMGSAVTSLAIRKGHRPAQVLQAAAQYRQQVGDRLSVIEGNFDCDVSFIGDYVRRYIRNNNTRPVVFIDYLQILQPENERQSTKEAIDNTVTQLKRMSRDLNLTVLVISSVNRANYLTPIDFESLKESGGIEYTADVIWGLQLQCLKEDLFDKQNNIKARRNRINAAKKATPREIELVCLKNRYGVANFSCFFDYYPAHDLFQEVPGPEDFREVTRL